MSEKLCERAEPSASTQGTVRVIVCVVIATAIELGMAWCFGCEAKSENVAFCTLLLVGQSILIRLYELRG